MTDQRQDFVEFLKIRHLYIMILMSQICVLIAQMWWVACGWGLLLAAVVWCYMRRKNVQGHDAFSSHYRWLIRTFWIGVFFVTPLFVVATGTVAGHLGIVDLENVPPDTMASFRHARWILKGLYFSWWFGRLLIGYALLRQNREIKHVKTWIF